MTRLTIPAVALLTVLAAGGTCRAVDSGVTIDSFTKKPNGANYDITVKGKITLGTNDTYSSAQAYITKPDGTQLPMALNMPVPDQGQTVNYTASTTGVAPAAGNWKVTVEMSIISGGQNKKVSNFTNFTLP